MKEMCLFEVVRSATTRGESMMLMLLAVNWVTLVPETSPEKTALVRSTLLGSAWTTWAVREMREVCGTVHTQARTTAIAAKVPV